MQLDMIEDLLRTANITPVLNDDINRNKQDLSYEDAEWVIERLRATQIDKLDSGYNYSQRDIIYKLKQMGL